MKYSGVRFDRAARLPLKDFKSPFLDRSQLETSIVRLCCVANCVRILAWKVAQKVVPYQSWFLRNACIRSRKGIHVAIRANLLVSSMVWRGHIIQFFPA